MAQDGKGKQKTDNRGFIRIYEEQRPLPVEPVLSSPCTAECPLGTNVKAYVSLIAAGRFSEALEEVRKTNPFPGICGRVCPHPCEDGCLRGEIDDPVAIAALKRFLADYELRRGIVPRYERLKKDQGRVAVVGAGPAGLTCAHDLASDGLEVAVFEALPVAGGMMAVGIPAYRLPKDILGIEIAAIEALGVDIRLNTTVGKDQDLEDLIEDYDAVFIGAGALRPRALGVPGERDVKKGLIDWVQFLRESGLGRGTCPGVTVVVIGGGNTAVDCARVALRLGTKNVKVLYRRSRPEMPAYSEEIFDAQEEGVEFHFLAAPVRLLVEKGSLVGMECIRMQLGKKDQSGRPRALPVPGDPLRCSNPRDRTKDRPVISWKGKQSCSIGGRSSCCRSGYAGNTHRRCLCRRRCCFRRCQRSGGHCCRAPCRKVDYAVSEGSSCGSKSRQRE